MNSAYSVIIRPIVSERSYDLMEQGKYAEASRVFRLAFALDSGQTDAIRENLRRALAKIESPSYDPVNKGEFSLVRRGNGQYLLLTKH